MVIFVTPATAGEENLLINRYKYTEYGKFDEVTLDLSKYNDTFTINICLKPHKCFEYSRAEVAAAIKIFNCLYRNGFIQPFDYLE